MAPAQKSKALTPPLSTPTPHTFSCRNPTPASPGVAVADSALRGAQDHVQTPGSDQGSACLRLSCVLTPGAQRLSQQNCPPPGSRRHVQMRSLEPRHEPRSGPCLQGHSAWPSTAFRACSPRGVTAKTQGALSCWLLFRLPEGPSSAPRAPPTHWQEEQKVLITANVPGAAEVLEVVCGMPRAWVKSKAGCRWEPRCVQSRHRGLGQPPSPGLSQPHPGHGLCVRRTGAQTSVGSEFGLQPHRSRG